MALEPGAKEKLDTIAEERGIKLIFALSRVVEWFVDQDKTLQGIILNQVSPADEVEVLGLIHKRLVHKIAEQLPQDLGKEIAEKKKHK